MAFPSDRFAAFLAHRLNGGAGEVTEQPALPAKDWGDLRRQLLAGVEPMVDGLRLTLQAQGFAVLREIARATARVRAANGAIDMRCRFDESGRALLVLADTPEVREGLASFSVVLLPAGGAPAP
jgi:hypothetical protein